MLTNPLAMGQTPFPAEVDSLIRAGIDHSIMSDFVRAESAFRGVVERHPDHIAGYFYQAALLQSKMMDYESDLWEEDFYAVVKRALEMGESRIERGDADAWVNFYLGSTHSYKALYQGASGALIPAFFSARKGVGYLEEAVKRDSTLYDAHLLIGNYKYWSGRFYKFFRWLPWIRDEREEGIRRIRLAVARGTFSRWVGLSSLAWIEYDRKEYIQALRHFMEGLRKYPGSRFFLWGLADTAYRLGFYEQAADAYENLLTAILNMAFNNGYNEVVCRFKLVKTYFADKQYEKALAHCHAILNREVEPKIARRIESRVKATRKYKKRCDKHLEAGHEGE